MLSYKHIAIYLGLYMPGLTQYIIQRLEVYAKIFTADQSTELTWLDAKTGIDLGQFVEDYAAIAEENSEQYAALKATLDKMHAIITLYQGVKNNVEFKIATKDDLILLLQILHRHAKNNFAPQKITIEGNLPENSDISNYLIAILAKNVNLTFKNCVIGPNIAKQLIAARQKAGRGTISLEDVTIAVSDLREINNAFNSAGANSAAGAASAAAEVPDQKHDQKTAPSANPICIKDHGESFSYHNYDISELEIKNFKDFSVTTLTEKLNNFIAWFPPNVDKKVRLSGEMKFTSNDRCGVAIKPDSTVTALVLDTADICNVQFMASIFQRFPRLQTLIFHECTFDEKDEVLKTLIAQLNNNPPLQKLHFNECLLSNAITHGLTYAVLKGNNNITDLSLGKTDDPLFERLQIPKQLWSKTMAAKAIMIYPHYDSRRIGALLEGYETSQQLTAYPDYKQDAEKLHTEFENALVKQLEECFLSIDRNAINGPIPDHTQWRENYDFCNARYKDAAKIFSVLPFTRQQQFIKQHESEHEKIYQLANKLEPKNVTVETMQLFRPILVARVCNYTNLHFNKDHKGTNVPAVHQPAGFLPSWYDSNKNFRYEMYNTLVDLAENIYQKKRSANTSINRLFGFQLPPDTYQHFKDFKRQFGTNDPLYPQIRKFLALDFRTKLLQKFTAYMKLESHINYSSDTTPYENYSFEKHSIPIIGPVDTSADEFLRNISSSKEKEINLEQLQTALGNYEKSRKGAVGTFRCQVLDHFKAPNCTKDLNGLLLELKRLINYDFPPATSTPNDKKTDTATAAAAPAVLTTDGKDEKTPVQSATTSSSLAQPPKTAASASAAVISVKPSSAGLPAVADLKTPGVIPALAPSAPPPELTPLPAPEAPVLEAPVAETEPVAPEPVAPVSPATTIATGATNSPVFSASAPSEAEVASAPEAEVAAEPEPPVAPGGPSDKTSASRRVVLSA